jgi:vanillate/3-O-methylgallate O-demethylase
MSLQDRIDAAGSTLALLAHPVPVAPGAVLPYTPFHSNWRDEQRAWGETAVLFNQSWHMTDFYVSGPDALKLLSDTSTNSYENFAEGRAKQYLAVNDQGHVIGDEILFALPDGVYAVVGEPPAQNWIAYQAERGGYDVTIEIDPGMVATGKKGSTPKRMYRYEIQGPNTQQILDKAAGRHVDRVPFFGLASIEIGGLHVQLLGHTMAAAPGDDNTGLELFGPEKDHEAFLEAILAAGAEFGLVRGGAISYNSALAEGGWIPAPLPAIFSDDLREYRKHLADYSLEGVFGSFGLRGSFHRDAVEAYYSTPWDLGYGHLVKFDHDFIGRPALERLAKEPKRRKVWLMWDPTDTERLLVDATLDRPHRPRDLPTPITAEYRDEIVTSDGTPVGIAHIHGYTVNIGSWVSVGAVDSEYAVDGTPLEIVWGDWDGGAGNPFIPNHEQRRIRTVVRTAPPAHH